MKYELKSFRLNKETIKNLEKIKGEKGLSYNLLFWEFIKQHNQGKIKNNMKYDIKAGDDCPHCKIGKIRKRQSKYGEFLACDQFPHCAFKQNIPQKLDIGQAGYKD